MVLELKEFFEGVQELDRRGYLLDIVDNKAK